MPDVLFPNPAQHPDWVPPQSEKWYTQLIPENSRYQYPWRSQFDEPTGETIFKEKLTSYFTDGFRIPDVGCGHGEYTVQFASKVKEVIGIDVRENFIATANRIKTFDNVRFCVVNVHDGLPFSDGYFDAVFMKMGPWLFHETSSEGKRVLKPSGLVAGLFHGYTDGGLRIFFAGLYTPPDDKDPLIDGVKNVENELKSHHLTDMKVHGIAEVEYLITPEDVLIKKCFGQCQAVKEYVWRECLDKVQEVFYKNATSKGLRVIN